jgi:hypothetical protein
MSQPRVIAVDDKGEFQFPDEIMDHHSWGPGSRLALEVIPGGLLIRTATIEGHDSEPEA